MDRVRVVVAKPITRSASSASAKSPTTKYILRGRLSAARFHIGASTDAQSSYVEMLENQQSQLVSGLQELYRRTQNGQGWIGSSLKETNNGAPLTHDILERLGALKQDTHDSTEPFEEDLNLMQQRLIANGAGFVARDNMSDTSSEIDQSPMFEQMPSKSSFFSESFSFTQLPPTPPNSSPYPRTARTVPASKSQAARHSSASAGMSWNPAVNGFDDNMTFLTKFDPSLEFNALPPQMFQNAMSMNGMNPTLPMKDWGEEEDFQRFFNPTLL